MVQYNYIVLYSEDKMFESFQPYNSHRVFKQPTQRSGSGASVSTWTNNKLPYLSIRSGKILHKARYSSGQVKEIIIQKRRKQQ